MSKKNSLLCSKIKRLQRNVRKHFQNVVNLIWKNKQILGNTSKCCKLDLKEQSKPSNCNKRQGFKNTKRQWVKINKKRRRRTINIQIQIQIQKQQENKTQDGGQGEGSTWQDAARKQCQKRTPNDSYIVFHVVRCSHKCLRYISNEQHA